MQISQPRANYTPHRHLTHEPFLITDASLVPIYICRSGPRRETASGFRAGGRQDSFHAAARCAAVLPFLGASLSPSLSLFLSLAGARVVIVVESVHAGRIYYGKVMLYAQRACGVWVPRFAGLGVFWYAGMVMDLGWYGICGLLLLLIVARNGGC